VQKQYLPYLCNPRIEALKGSKHKCNYGVKQFSYQVMRAVSTTDAGVKGPSRNLIPMKKQKQSTFP